MSGRDLVTCTTVDAVLDLIIGDLMNNALSEALTLEMGSPLSRMI